MTNGGPKSPLVAPKRNFTDKKRAKPASRGRAKKPAKPKVQRGFFSRMTRGLFGIIFRTAWWIGLRVSILLALVISAAVGYYYTTLPLAEDMVDGRARGSVTMLDHTGEVFAWRGEQFGGMVSATTVSPHLKNAVVATEDKRFYRHFGISPRGVASAIRINLREGRGPLQGNGGSTITQQTAKLVCYGQNYDPELGVTEREFEADCRRTTMPRKIKEALYSLAMELKYTKDEILTIYLNRAFLGAGSRGVEAASQRYFGKPSVSVNAAEAAMLAGLLKAPSRYAPTRNLARAQGRAAVIVALMIEQGYLTAAEAQQALNSPAVLSEAAAARAGGYFADWVMEAGPAFLTKSTTEDVLIRTTFDPRIQEAAEAALAFVFDSKVKEGSVAQAAIVVMSADGAVRAMVGGRQTDVPGQFNRATQALRQTGSSFKPFVYAAALDLGYRFDHTVEDAPLTLYIPGSGNWSPKNYTGEFLGEITLTEALAFSINTAAVRVSEDVGRDIVRGVAREFGVASELAVGPAVALGASESTLLEMTGAYAGILNGGQSATPYGLVELTLQGDETPLMGKSGGTGERVITPDAARQLVYMMNQVTEIGSGRRAQLPDRPIAGKTGTTQGARDAWFIGFSADYVAGVWMGYDDNSKLSGVTGGGLPADIWRETMLRVHEGVEPKPLPMIDPIAEASVFEDTGTQRDPAQTILEELLGAIFGNQ